MRRRVGRMRVERTHAQKDSKVIREYACVEG